MPDNNFQDNPYLSARKEYGDSYGLAVKDEAHWRQISIIKCISLCTVKTCAFDFSLRGEILR